MCDVKDKSCGYWLWLVFRYIYKSVIGLLLFQYGSIDMSTNDNALLVTFPFYNPLHYTCS